MHRDGDAMTKDIHQQVLDLKKAFSNAATTMSTGLDKALIKAGLLIERDAKLYLTEDHHVDTGRLRASITHRLIDKPRGRAVQVGTNVEYASDVEFGTGPHTVPIADLLAWAKRKGLDEEAAHAIQQQIEKYGTKPHPFLHPALESNAVAIQALITSALKRSLAEAGK